MKPIYAPKGAAKEYGDYALNIYTGCPHRYYYCFAPQVLHRDREQFHSRVEPRKNIVHETQKQLEREQITGKLIHLCFTCDPYPTGYDTTVTREIIKLLKEYGNHVQILTKAPTTRDFDLMDKDDWFGVTYDGGFRIGGFIPSIHMPILVSAHNAGIKTWISFEPVLNENDVLRTIYETISYVDKIKIGKLNYHPSDINWAQFGIEVERLCQELELDYYIKDGLRKCMGGAEA